MEYAEKMFLVPQHQLDKLRNDHSPGSIRQVVENDLDVSIRNILGRNNLDAHEKAKLYASVLQRYLTIVKQGEMETNTLTLSLPPASNVNTVTNVEPDGGYDVITDVLRNVPSRSKKNVEYVLDKMSKSKDVSSWNELGEFVLNGRTVPGSHILDLVKSITAPHLVSDARRPRGWGEFLEAFAILNIPMSTVPNKHVREKISLLKNRNPDGYDTQQKDIAQTLVKSVETPVFVSPIIDRSKWLDF